MEGGQLLFFPSLLNKLIDCAADNFASITPKTTNWSIRGASSSKLKRNAATAAVTEEEQNAGGDMRARVLWIQIDANWQVTTRGRTKK